MVCDKLSLCRVNKPSDECPISLTLHDGNDTTSSTIVKFCSTDDPPQSSRHRTDLNFTSSGSQLTIWLRGAPQSFTTSPSTTGPSPLRHLPPRMSFVAAFAFVDSTAASVSSSSSSSSASTSSERPYADSRLQLHATDNDNASMSFPF